MPARNLTSADIGWVVSRLSERRSRLAAMAPVFWRPAPDAEEAHRTFLTHLLTDGGALGYRTEESVLIASPRGDGWLVDDAYAPDEHWAGDGAAIWRALASDVRGSEVRFVVPTHETERADFARTEGLQLQESWWLVELDSGGGEGGVKVDLPGGQAVTVAAPPIYAPGGPVLFMPSVSDANVAVAAAVEAAPRLGCAAIVVNRPADDHHLASNLSGLGFRRHCDYFAGTI